MSEVYASEELVQKVRDCVNGPCTVDSLVGVIADLRILRDRMLRGRCTFVGEEGRCPLPCEIRGALHCSKHSH